MLFWCLSLIFLYLIFGSLNANGNVIIKNLMNETLIGFLSKSSTFGPEIHSDGFIGQLMYAEPIDACLKVTPAPVNLNYPWIALIQRHNCSFIDKVLNVQAAGYDAAIVYNTESDAVIRMQGESLEIVRIPSVFIGKTSGRICSEYFGTNFTVILTDYSIPGPSDLLMLIPFAVIIPVCLIFIIVLLSLRCIGRRIKNIRLSQSQLRRLPLEKFRKGDRYEVCAICLEDYQDGDKLRILPCSHTYHQKCIDPWLTGTKQTCPLCNKAVFGGEEEVTGEPSVDERTPLLENIATDHHLSEEVAAAFRQILIDSPSSSDSENCDDTLTPHPARIFQSPIEVYQQGRNSNNNFIDTSTAMSLNTSGVDYQEVLIPPDCCCEVNCDREGEIRFVMNRFGDDSESEIDGMCGTSNKESVMCIDV